MRRDHGAVLINALVIVLVISAIAAALLTRSEDARLRTAESQGAAQLGLYLDAGESLLPRLLREPFDSGTATKGQSWARQSFTYEIDRGGVTLQISDLQAGLNVNWLARPDDFIQDAFTRLFSELGVPVSLVDAIADFVRPGGPSRANVYLSRTPPIMPSGGPVATMPELRQVDGMTDEIYRILSPYLAALPVDTKVNLNTAAKPVLRAVLAPFPPELMAETLARLENEPLDGLGDLRARLAEILQTEDFDAYPLDRLSTGSDWFAARITAGLDDRSRVRQVVLHRVFEPKPGWQLAYRWTEYD